MTHAYSEDQLVEQPAIGLFEELGWQTVSALEEVFGTGGTLGRETKGEVCFASPGTCSVRAIESLSAAGGDFRRHGRIDP